MLITELHLKVFLDKLIDLDKKEEKSIMSLTHKYLKYRSNLSIKGNNLNIKKYDCSDTAQIVRDTYLFNFFYTFVFLE